MRLNLALIQNFMTEACHVSSFPIQLTVKLKCCVAMATRKSPPPDSFVSPGVTSATPSRACIFEYTTRKSPLDVNFNPFSVYHHDHGHDPYGGLVNPVIPEPRGSLPHSILPRYQGMQSYYVTYRYGGVCLASQL